MIKTPVPRLVWLAAHLLIRDANWIEVERVGLELLEAGNDAPEIVALASVTQHTTDLLMLVDHAINFVGAQMPSETEAWELAAFETASDILLGRINPYRGGARLWGIADEAPSLKDQLKPFVGPVSEWEEDIDHRREYEHEIVETAKQYVGFHFAKEHPLSASE